MKKQKAQEKKTLSNLQKSRENLMLTKEQLETIIGGPKTSRGTYTTVSSN